MNLSRLALAAALVLSAAAAQAATKLSQAATDALGTGLLPVAAIHDMKGGRWGFAISPFAWKTTSITREGTCCTAGGGAVNGNSGLPTMSGFGGAAALTVEFNQHWGAEVFFATARSGSQDLSRGISGLAPTAVKTLSGSGVAGGTLNNLGGTVIGAMATWDHFADHPRFRLPVSLGIFQGWQYFDFNHDFSNPQNGGAAQQESVNFRRNFIGVTAGIAADFTVFKNFRVGPGILVGQGFAGQEANFDYKVTRGGSTTSFANTLTGSPSFGAVYFSAEYRPWGLGYTVTLVPDVATINALTLSRRFNY